jgi:hypothetical protein
MNNTAFSCRHAGSAILRTRFAAVNYEWNQTMGTGMGTR